MTGKPRFEHCHTWFQITYPYILFYFSKTSNVENGLKPMWFHFRNYNPKVEKLRIMENLCYTTQGSLNWLVSTQNELTASFPLLLTLTAPTMNPCESMNPSMNPWIHNGGRRSLTDGKKLGTSRNKFKKFLTASSMGHNRIIWWEGHTQGRKPDFLFFFFTLLLCFVLFFLLVGG